MKDLETQDVKMITGTFCDIIYKKEICNRTCTKCPLNNDKDEFIEQAKAIIENCGSVIGGEYI